MRFFSSSTHKKGFTLMEVLVVVGIIGVLASVVLMNVQQARMKSRDAKRVNELEQVKLALRLFKDSYGRYPSDTDSPVPGTGQCASNTSLSPNGCLQVLVTKGLLPALPKDPLTGLSTTYSYDNWCRTAVGTGPQYRMWVGGESYTGGTDFPCGAGNDPWCWWNKTTIGITTCTDPS